MDNSNRLYKDLAWIWPYFGSLEDYEGESLMFLDLLRRYAARPVESLLDMGCGGGKNSHAFAQCCAVTGIDISPAMLELARELNPKSSFLQADMRNAELDCRFDAVFVNDSVMYMQNPAELAAVFRTAWQHLEPGGTILVPVELTTETFRQNNSVLTELSCGPDRDVVILENDYDPDPADEQFDLTFVYLIRENGLQRIEHDHHTLGLFPLDTWRTLLRETGFEVHELRLELDDDILPVFVGLKPDNAE